MMLSNPTRVVGNDVAVLVDNVADLFPKRSKFAGETLLGEVQQRTEIDTS
jgi:hypothetical protein